jgi:hypothetical protein
LPKSLQGKYGVSTAEFCNRLFFSVPIKQACQRILAYIYRGANDHFHFILANMEKAAYFQQIFLLHLTSCFDSEFRMRVGESRQWKA